MQKSFSRDATHIVVVRLIVVVRATIVEVHVYTEIVQNCSGATLQAIIEQIVSANAEINSDGWRGYDGLVDVGYDKHYRVNPESSWQIVHKGI